MPVRKPSSIVRVSRVRIIERELDPVREHELVKFLAELVAARRKRLSAGGTPDDRR